MIYSVIKVKENDEYVLKNIQHNLDLLYATCSVCGKEIHLDVELLDKIAKKDGFEAMCKYKYVCDECKAKED